MAARPEDIGLDNMPQSVRDLRDLGHELSGETSRINRFLPEGSSGYGAQSEEKKSEKRYQSLLEMLLTEDPQYAALYSRVAEKLDRAQSAVDKVMADIKQRLETSEIALQRMRDSAPELADGTKVFRSRKDGHVYTEDGQRLDDEQARGIEFPPDAASLEDYRAQKDAQDTALRQREEIERYQRDVLDPMKERMRDPDHVYTKDELEEIDRNVDASLPDMLREDYRSADPSVSAVEGNTTTSAAHNMVEATNLDVPEMGRAFKAASVDIRVPGSPPALNPVQETTRTPC
jgi:hypothetical protein